MNNMVILHFVPSLNAVRKSAFLRYKTALFEAMAKRAETHVLTLDATDVSYGNVIVENHPSSYVNSCRIQRSFAKTLSAHKPDIVHIHAVWNIPAYKLFCECQKLDIPTVITADHQLDKWHMRHHYWNKKFLQLPIYQKRMLSHSSALHFVTRQEQSYFKTFNELPWVKSSQCLNEKSEVVEAFNISREMSAQDMSDNLLSLYKKVIDSTPFSRMDEKEQHIEDLLLAIGYNNGNFLVSTEDISLVESINETSWRRILLHSSDEGIIDYVKAGAKAINAAMPVIDIERINRFPPKAKNHDIKIKQVARKLKSDKTLPLFEQELCILITTVLHKVKYGTVHRSDFARICKMLKSNEYDEELVNAQMHKLGLSNDVARIFQIIKERYNLSDGFMFTDPLDDKKTEILRRKLYKSKIQ